MIEKYIFLKTEQDAVRLNGIVTKYPYDIDMVHGKYVVDAKSILGVLGVGVGNKTKLCINTEEAEQLLEEITPYLCG